MTSRHSTASLRPRRSVHPLRRSVFGWTLLAASLGVSVVAGCGAAAPRVEITPLTSEHEHLFENGADMIGNPDLLSGSWLTTWQRELDRRVELADAIGIVEIATIRQDIDLERHETYRLVGHVIERRTGALGDDVSLVTREGETGFPTVDGIANQILNQRFVVFVKWTGDAAQPVARWHIAPATEAVIQRADRRIRRQEAETARATQRR